MRQRMRPISSVQDATSCRAFVPPLRALFGKERQDPGYIRIILLQHEETYQTALPPDLEICACCTASVCPRWVTSCATA